MLQDLNQILMEMEEKDEIRIIKINGDLHILKRKKSPECRSIEQSE